MKIWSLLFVLLPATTWAINEVECTGLNSSGNQVVFEVEQSWGGSIRDAHLFIYSDGTSSPEETVYRIYSMRPQNRRLLYNGTDGLRLEVDLFPDRTPRWGRSYRSRLAVSAEVIGGLECRFPQARP